MFIVLIKQGFLPVPRSIGDVGRFLEVVAVAVDPHEGEVVPRRLVELQGRLHLARRLQVLGPPTAEGSGGIRWFNCLKKKKKKKKKHSLSRYWAHQRRRDLGGIDGSIVSKKKKKKNGYKKKKKKNRKKRDFVMHYFFSYIIKKNKVITNKKKLNQQNLIYF